MLDKVSFRNEVRNQSGVGSQSAVVAERRSLSVVEMSRSDNKKSEVNWALTLISRISTNRVLCHLKYPFEVKP
ncbi:hypothetical protein GGE08_000453 [Muricauda sp. ARW1Y1]|nr:hypothetical protein [Muricauda sp. ARW1Y1]